MYNDSFSTWTVDISQTTNNILSNIRRGKDLYDKWTALIYGLTNTQIKALPQLSGITDADINNINYALGAFNDLYGLLYGTAAPAQNNRENYLVPFI